MFGLFSDVVGQTQMDRRTAGAPSGLTRQCRLWKNMTVQGIFFPSMSRRGPFYRMSIGKCIPDFNGKDLASG
jgi:hypothetical protein